MYQAIERCLPIIVDELTLLLCFRSVFFFGLKLSFHWQLTLQCILIAVIWFHRLYTQITLPDNINLRLRYPAPALHTRLVLLTVTYLCYLL